MKNKILIGFSILLLLVLAMAYSVFAVSLTSVDIVSTSSFNLSFDNLTLDIVSSGTENYKNISTWYPITVLNMPFEYGSNATFTEDYTHVNNGTVTGATYNSTGGYDGFGAYKFNSSNSNIITINHSNSISFNKTQSHTINIWIKTLTTLVSSRIFQKNPNYYAYFGTVGSPNQRIDFKEYDGSNLVTVSVTYPFFNNDWNMITFVVNRDTQKAYGYVNGILLNTDTNISDVGDCNSTSNLIIGKGGGYAFNGSIDEVKIFNKSLSANQIKEIYKNSSKILSETTTIGETWKACVSLVNTTYKTNEICNNIYIKESFYPTIDFITPNHATSLTNNFITELDLYSSSNLNNVSCEITLNNVLLYNFSNSTLSTSSQIVYSPLINISTWDNSRNYLISCEVCNNYNCITDDESFRVNKITYTFKRYECDLSTNPQAIGLIGFTLILLLIWVFAFYIKIPALSIFIGFVMTYFAWYIAACFMFANVLFIVLGLLSMAYGIVYALSN